MARYTLVSNDEFANIKRLPTAEQTQIYNALGRNTGSSDDNFFTKRWKSIDNAIGTTGASVVSAVDSARENQQNDERYKKFENSLEDIYRQAGYNSQDDYYNAKEAAEKEVFGKYGFDIDDYWNKRADADIAGDNATISALDQSYENAKRLLSSEDADRLSKFNTAQQNLVDQTATNMAEQKEAQQNWEDYRTNSDVGKRVNQDRGKFLGSAMNTLSTAADIMLPGAGVVFNAGQGAWEGLADELEQNGLENFDWGRAGQNMLTGAVTGGVTGALNKGLSNKLAQNGGNLFKGGNGFTRGLNNLGSKTAAGRIGSTIATGAARGALSGAVGGATGAGLQSALNGQDVGTGISNALQGAVQGAGQGALTGGAMAGANMALNATPGVGNVMRRLNEAGDNWNENGNNTLERLKNTWQSGDSKVANRLTEDTRAVGQGFKNVGEGLGVLTRQGIDRLNNSMRSGDSRVGNIISDLRSKNGVFGKEYTMFENAPNEAINYLNKRGGGVAKRAIPTSEDGSLDLPYGSRDSYYNERTQRPGGGMGLAHIEGDDGRTIQDAYNMVDTFGNGQRAYEADPTRGAYENADSTRRAVFSTDYNGEAVDPYVLSAYNKKVPATESELNRDVASTSSSIIPQNDQNVNSIVNLNNALDDIAQRVVSGDANMDDYWGAYRNTVESLRNNYSNAELANIVENATNTNQRQLALAALGPGYVYDNNRRIISVDHIPDVANNSQSVHISVPLVGKSLQPTVTREQFTEKYGYDPRETINLSKINTVNDAVTALKDLTDANGGLISSANIEKVQNKFPALKTMMDKAGETLRPGYSRDDLITKVYNDNVASDGNTPSRMTAEDYDWAEYQRRYGDSDLPEDVQNMRIAGTAETPETEMYRTLTGDSSMGGNGNGGKPPVVGDLEEDDFTNIGKNTEGDRPRTPEQKLKDIKADRLRDRAAEDLIDQLGTVRKPVAQALHMVDNVKQLMGEGLTKPEEWQLASDAITGSNGVVSRLHKNLIEEAGDIDTFSGWGGRYGDTIEDTVDYLIKSEGLVDSDAKGVKNEIMAVLESLPSRLDGSIDMTDNASDVMRGIRELERKRRQYIGENPDSYSTSPESSKQKARVLEKFCSGLENIIYDKIKDVRSIITPEAIQELKNYFPNNEKWAESIDEKFANVKTGKDLRAIQQPYVRTSQYLDSIKENYGTYGQRVGDAYGNTLSQVTKRIPIVGGILSQAANTPTMQRLYANINSARADKLNDKPIDWISNKKVSDRTTSSNTSEGNTEAITNTSRISTASHDDSTSAPDAPILPISGLPASNDISTPITDTSYNPATQIYNAIGRTEGQIQSDQARAANYLSDVAQEAEVVDNTGAAPNSASTSVYNTLTGTSNGAVGTSSGTTVASGNYGSLEEERAKFFFPPTGDYWSDMLSQAMRNARNAEDWDAFGQLYEMYQNVRSNSSANNGAKTVADLSSTQQNQLAKLDSADSAIDELESLYNNAGGGKGMIAGNLQSIAGDWGLDSNARTYNQMSEGLVNQIAQAIGKTDSLNTEGEVKRALSLIPQLTDDAQTAKNKLETLRRMLQTTKASYNTAYGLA